MYTHILMLLTGFALGILCWKIKDSWPVHSQPVPSYGGNGLWITVGQDNHCVDHSDIDIPEVEYKSLDSQIAP